MLGGGAGLLHGFGYLADAVVHFLYIGALLGGGLGDAADELAALLDARHDFV